MATLRDDLDLSSDQFYRRVKLLSEAGVIAPERGSKNRLLLSEADEAALRQFVAIERNNQERSLEWCLERLRYEQEHGARVSAEQAASKASGDLEWMTSQKKYSMQEVTRLRIQLKRLKGKYRRLRDGSIFRQLWIRIVDRFRGDDDDDDRPHAIHRGP